ncbi:gliding motility lipoprotein GldH [Cyclobacterium marinum]|nr:gliding motility lipoprotein GldH [Cyclobacterium marinum]
MEKTEISLMKNNNIFAIALLAFILWASVACNNGRIYESYQDLEEYEWVVTDTISFQMDSLETNLGTRSILSVRYDDKYEYNNLYVRYFLKDSSRKILSDTLLNIQLFDPKTGKPLGQGYGNRRIMYDTLPGNRVPAKSTYHFVQYMRKDTLSGIESVGLKINANN